MPMSVAEISRQKKRADILKKKREEREIALKEQVNGWFAKFDTDHSGSLDRDELRQLLAFVQPNHPPTEAALDFLLEKATEIDTYSMHVKGDVNGTITWGATKEVPSRTPSRPPRRRSSPRALRAAVKHLHQASASAKRPTRIPSLQTVVRYRDYVRDQLWIDAVFKKHDADGSGELEEAELLPLLQARSVHQLQGPPATAQSTRRSRATLVPLPRSVEAAVGARAERRLLSHRARQHAWPPSAITWRPSAITRRRASLTSTYP